MKRFILSFLFVFFAVHAAYPADKKYKKPMLTEKQQQARLMRFKPVFTKSINANLPDREFLLEVARDTWGYFRDVVDKSTGFPLDNVMIFSSYSKVNSYTTTTNIGLYMMCVVSAYDFGFITKNEGVRRIRLAIESLKRLENWEGQFYNYYGTIKLDRGPRYVSSVDNGWLAAGLIVARQAFDGELGRECEMLLSKFRFRKLYDPKMGQFYLGYDADKAEYPQYHYGLVCTEPRITSYIAIAKGDVQPEHWFKLQRTLPAEWDWQSQKPRGETRQYLGQDVFEGYYTFKEFKYVPSWGGSMFEFLMPGLVLKEQELALDSFAKNNKAAVNVQIDYALNEMKYPVWGISPCSVPGDPWGYGEYGVKVLGSKGYEDKSVITPHATFLAIGIEPEKAVKNLRELLKFTGMYGEYGFYDAVNVKNGAISTKYLCLDQAMSLIALNNYLNNNAIKERFHRDARIKAQEKLLTTEKFY
ncbi:MAG: glucoamylase family protein [Elusimicrobiota bacterium]